MRGLHWPDPRQVPVGSWHITEVGHVLSTDLRDGWGEAEELKIHRDSARAANPAQCTPLPQALTRLQASDSFEQP